MYGDSLLFSIFSSIFDLEALKPPVQLKVCQFLITIVSVM